MWGTFLFTCHSRPWPWEPPHCRRPRPWEPPHSRCPTRIQPLEPALQAASEQRGTRHSRARAPAITHWGLGHGRQHQAMIFNPAPGHPESVFTMRGVQLQTVQTFKYLGVHFHQDCTWTEHVKYVRGRMNKALGMWRPVLQCHYLTASVRIGLAYTFVYTHAVYGAEAWAAPRDELDKMDAICKAALRLVFGLHQTAMRRSCLLTVVCCPSAR